MTGSQLTRHLVTALAGLLSAAACLARPACGSPKPPAFTPGGSPATAATPMATSSGPGSVVMPPFGGAKLDVLRQERQQIAA